MLAIACNEDEERFGTTSLAYSIRRGGWDRATWACYACSTAKSLAGRASD
ncbi:hypothetical protein ACFQZ4_52460 [Catellatospora coxensis]